MGDKKDSAAARQDKAKIYLWKIFIILFTSNEHLHFISTIGAQGDLDVNNFKNYLMA